MNKKTIIFCVIFSITLICDATIQIAWEETFGGTNSDACNAVCEAPDGGFLLAGYTNSNGADKSDIYLIKTNAEGTEEWSQSYGDIGWQIAKSVCVSTDENGYVVTGYTTESGTFDIFCLKVDLLGNELWYDMIGGDSFDIAESICQTTDGGYLLCG